MMFLKHSPVIALGVSLLFLLFSIQQVTGVRVSSGDDAFGKGLAGLLYTFLFVLHLALVLISFTWYKGASTELSVFKTIYHLLLYTPAVGVLGFYSTQAVDYFWNQSQQIKSFKAWKKKSKTQFFQSESLGISFSYASTARSKINSSYFVDVEVEEIKDSIVLLSVDKKEKSFLGMVKKIAPESIDQLKDEESCVFRVERDDRFKYLRTSTVRKLEGGPACVHNAMEQLNAHLDDINDSHQIGELYTFYENENTLWLAATTSYSLQFGPIEENRYDKKSVDWFHTLKFMK